MTYENTTERHAIEAAITRLLDGTPQRSTGALSIVQLAVEADVKRWVLTHKHTDLAEQFTQRVRTQGKMPAAFQDLDRRAKTAEAANDRLRQENNRLRKQVNIYAQVIHELTTERNRTSQQSPSGKLSHITTHRH
ncbi:hypothetical protein CH278_00625 [Rhodococcus sp. 05-2254-5]|nr:MULTISPECIES: hypothetical protein [Rhodococcus]OZE97167.1 hypothetical protein CH300_26920 [Rhodococcus sp. 15-1154-1]OZE97819.1 hypothetical protein CH302_13455 [Rhodococcus sp. 15-2388-1-1a]OZE18722.1 hypothetical protein CH256_26340 [Rhodococcus sp. 05-2254-6]OZE39772.1 hypothetical protein CH278_00625 [Rhodococcus sp. 05-2254-5]OZE60907.1 hypothetical protein CH269_04575 [Rhodococcus sp. 05-2254-1]